MCGSSVVGRVRSRSGRHHHHCHHCQPRCQYFLLSWSWSFHAIAVLFLVVGSLQNWIGGCWAYTAVPHIFWVGHRPPLTGADKGWGTTVPCPTRSPRRHGTVAVSAASSITPSNPDDDLEQEDGPEISLMPGYVADFLRKTKDRATQPTENEYDAPVRPSIASAFEEEGDGEEEEEREGETVQQKEAEDDFLVSGNGSTNRIAAPLAPTTVKEGVNVDNDVANDDEYLIAIPLDECYELGLELESVQRAILYHCPVLVHACIPLAATRLPLLYVALAAATTTTTPSSDQILRQLRTIVAATVQEVLHENEDEQHSDDTPTSTSGGVTSDSSSLDEENPMDRVQRDDGRPDVLGINDDGYQPLLIPFGTLEIDGTGNEVLYTVGVPNARGTRTLIKLVDRLRHNLETASDAGEGQVGGFVTRQPDDPQQQSQPESGEAPAFRPRVPFVRLPRNWDDYLPQSSNAAEEDFFLTSDQGGNGISPILWGQWMDDKFGDAARMREIGIYRRRRHHRRPRQQGMTAPPTTDTDTQSATAEDDWTEAAFPWPAASVPLPRGNAALTQAERHFETYQKRRMEEAHEREQRLARGGKNEEDEEQAAMEGGGRPEETPVFRKTLNRLQAAYQLDEPTADVTLSQSKVNAANPESSLPRTQRDLPIKASDVNDDDDSWMRERIRKVIESRERVQAKLRLTDPKRTLDKVPLEENPVFAKYRNGTLVPNALVTPAVAPRTLPPFPSREYCVGFWRVVSSPTGFAVEEGDASRSDNLILRVDGTTAGGPILDQETRQKASAGTWKFSAANADESARVRIRLVIPPQKDRILVLQGSLERVAPSSSSTGEWALAPRGTFGIPELEERAARATADVEELLYCSGTVSIEDAVTGRNREDIGTFSLQKLNTPTDPSQFTITIPRNVRNQD